MKRKLEDFISNSEFKFWGIVISKLVYNHTRSFIAKRFDCSEAYVTQTTQKFEQDGGYYDQRLNNGGHNKKIKESVKEEIKRVYKKNPSSTSNQVVQKCDAIGIFLSDRTIRRARSEIGLVPVKATLLPSLSQKNLAERLKYCQEHINDKFSNVCFSDESCFQLMANKTVVWYNRGEENKPVLSAPKQNKKVMIWGGISRRGKTPLYIHRLDQKETVNADTYITCLEECLIDSMDLRYGEGMWRFLQDNARPHSAHDTKNFFKDQNIRVIQHPSYSPDLNPIEQVWAWMKKDIGKECFDNIEDLIEAIEDKWNELTIKFQNKLIDHHCEMVEKVLKNKGRYV